MNIEHMTCEEAEDLMADYGYAKHSDCRELVLAAFSIGVARASIAMKPATVTVFMKTGNIKLDEAWQKIVGRNRETQLKQVFEWVKTGHINLTEFTILIERVCQ